MNTDPISDLLTRIRNASSAHHQTALVPYSKIKENIVEVLKNNKYILDYKVIETGNHKSLEITLDPERSGLTLRRVSKPGQRIYTKTGDLKTIKAGLGIQVISTSKGLMTNFQAKKEGIGGEIICEIY